MPKPALWIPIDVHGNVIFDLINTEASTEAAPGEIKGTKHWPNPKSYETVETAKNIGVIKVSKNPFCFWVYQGGYMVER